MLHLRCGDLRLQPFETEQLRLVMVNGSLPLHTYEHTFVWRPIGNYPMTVGRGGLDSVVIYPRWGRIGVMPLDDQLRNNVGFIWGDTHGGDGTESRGPVGTFFLVTVPSERFPDRRYGYAVTAAHVVMSEKNPELRIRDAADEPVTFAINEWHTPYPGRDIAVALYPGDALPNNMVAVPIEVLGADALGWRPRLGAVFYYIGLLEPVEEMSNQLVPMVRVGNVGALYQAGVKVKHQPPQVAHLVDVRSRSGFSGSPCWMEMVLAGPGPIPKVAAVGGPSDLSGFNPLHYAQALMGILIGYADDAGVGVVLPIEQLREVLDHEEVKSMRDENDERIAKSREKGPFDEVSVKDDPTGTEDSFMRDLRKATKRIDQSDQEPKRTSE